ncbi:MAG: two-component system, chemotaxis family, sensor kinase CheA [Pyrinomonadaceae bacterium]|nr:two-component system, chemotaxis family, sensor kinase CheA [Pyrinomonadaceae bacterium]
MDQHRSEFLIEIEDLIEKVFADLDQLRENSANQNSPGQSIDQLFRHVHSIKGLSAAIGLDTVSHIAHELETLLDAVRLGRVAIDEQVLQISENAVDALAESLGLAASGIVEPSRRALFDQLQTTAKRGPSSADTEALLESIPSEIWQSLSEAEKQRLTSIAREGKPLFVVVATFEITSFDEEFFRLRESLAQLGEVIATSPTVDPQHSDRVNFRILYASPASSAELQNCIAGYAGEITTLERGQVSETVTRHQQPITPSANTVSASALANFVRTDLAKLDHLISSTHELFRATSNALGIAAGQKQRGKKAREQLQSLDETIRRSFMELENELINLRMVSLGPTLQRAMRSGQTAARATGKEINFEVAGKDLRVDKVLADALAEPLIHLIRNAVDHGIESAEERLQFGKEGPGKIRIDAISEGAQSRVRVSDDGRGIDPILISAAAARLGILSEPSELDFERSVRLIFRAGFSTLASATETSGRGVGLDVVETAVEQVGGELRVSSNPGAGTTFEIRLPVTFGLLSATVLVANGNRYCIPANQIIDISDSVREKKRAKKAQTHRDDEPSNLSDLLGQSPEPKRLRKSAQQVTCQLSASQQQANGDSGKNLRLIVDEVERTEEILVRSLGRHSGRWYGVAGATELRDGTVALVLDLARLLTGVQ